MNLHRHLVAASLCLLSCACSAGVPSGVTASDQPAGRAAVRAQSVQQKNPGAADNAGAAAAMASNGHSASVCDANDQVVFSCPLVKSTKIASICATPGKTVGDPAFYYAFGRPGEPELRFPASGQADNAAFSRTHLGFAGNNGGYAYSFANAGYKYIVYAISGEGASHEGAVIVQPSANAKQATKLACRSTAITETSDDQLIDATLRLKKDPRIQASGLPESR